MRAAWAVECGGRAWRKCARRVRSVVSRGRLRRCRDPARRALV